MIILNENYRIRTDTYNYILEEKKIIQDEQSKNCGKERYSIIGYYGTLEALYKGIIEREIKADITLLNNIEKIIKLKEDIMNHD